MFTMCWESQNRQKGREEKLSNEGYLVTSTENPYGSLWYVFLFKSMQLISATKYVEEI